jgi:hypothetical protein
MPAMLVKLLHFSYFTYQFELLTLSSSGVHESSEFKRYAPPMSQRAYANPFKDGLKMMPGTNPPPPEPD